MPWEECETGSPSPVPTDFHRRQTWCVVLTFFKMGEVDISKAAMFFCSSNNSCVAFAGGTVRG